MGATCSNTTTKRSRSNNDISPKHVDEYSISYTTLFTFGFYIPIMQILLFKIIAVLNRKISVHEFSYRCCQLHYCCLNRRLFDSVKSRQDVRPVVINDRYIIYCPLQYGDMMSVNTGTKKVFNK
ncbi:hypothetical protein GJ496_002421 [Pomphorhynchus laevis]|nr:hypothetical protein GJ496_002421 [Pomphorhynchus laevis]